MKKSVNKWLVLPFVFSIVLISSCTTAGGSNGTTPDTGGTEQLETPTELSQVVDSDPARIDNSQLPVTGTEELHLTGMQPDIDIDGYRLSVDGLVDNPISLTYDQVMTYPQVTEVVLLICPGFFVDNAEWTGVPVDEFLEKAGVKPEATTAVFTEIGGSYSKEIPLEDITGNDSIFLAHTANGEILTEKHGYPLRLVAKGRYGYDWVKWVESIEVN